MFEKLLEGLDIQQLRKMAKKLDTPEMRELYRRQCEAGGEAFKERIQQLAEEVEQTFKK